MSNWVIRMRVTLYTSHRCSLKHLPSRIYTVDHRGVSKFFIIRLALDGIFAAAVGFILTAAMLINYYFWNQFTHFNQHVGLQIGIFVFTLLLLYTKKVPTPFIVLLMILMGWLIPL